MTVADDALTAFRSDLPRIGDKLVSFSVLLPAQPAGRVGIAAGSDLAAALVARFPDAIVLHGGAAGPVPPGWLAWDGRRCPLPAGSLGLLIVDSRVASVAALRGALAPDATLAVLGRRGRYLLYPSAEHPQQVWRRGWPTPVVRGRVPQLKRAVGLRTRAKRGVPRLEITGPPAESLADRIGAQLRTAVGERLCLVGIETAGHTVLHYRGSRDWAVRLSLTDPAHDVQLSTTVAEQVPAAARYLPREIMRARTCGHPWAAAPWISSRRAGILARRDAVPDPFEGFAALAAALQTVVTGRTSAGWARAWCESVGLLPPAMRERFAGVLGVLDDGLPTGWCHGDPWPPNLLYDGRDVTVIDWDNATDGAPLGLDRLLIAAARIAHGDGVTMAVAYARLMDATDTADGTAPGADGGLTEDEVAGRRWADWRRPHRVALLLAAYLRYLHNRSLHDLGADRLQAELAEIGAAVDRALGDRRADAPARLAPAARRTAHGAIWLGLSAAVVKAGQTLVMFAVAAVLQPSALGLLAIGWLVVNVVGAFSDLGCTAALVYWRGDAERAARSALTLSLGLSVVLTAACWAAAPWISDVLNTSDGGTAVIRGLTSVLPCYAVADVTGELLRRDLAFARRIVPNVVATLCGIAVTLWLLLAQGFGIDAMVIGQIVQGVLTMLLSWLVRRPVGLGWRWSDIRGLVGYGGHLAGGTFAQLLLLNVDYVMVANVLGPTQLGKYSLAFRIAYLPFYNVAGVICTAAFPYLCRLRGPALGRAAAEVVAAALGLVIPVFAVLALFAPQLELLGDTWAGAVPALRWLCCYGVLLSLIQLCQTPLNAAGRPRDSLVLRVTHVGLLAGVLAALVHLGITAVAVGQVLAGAAVALMALGLVRRTVPGMLGRDFARALGPSALGVVAMAAVVLPLQWAVPSTRASLPVLAALVVLALAAFAVPVWWLGRERLIRAVRLVGARS